MQNDPKYSRNQERDSQSKSDITKQNLFEVPLIYANRQIINLEEMKRIYESNQTAKINEQACGITQRKANSAEKERERKVEGSTPAMSNLEAKYKDLCQKQKLEKSFAMSQERGKKLEDMLDAQMKLKEELQYETKFNQVLKMRCSRLQRQYQSAVNEIETLNKQLQSKDAALEAKMKAEEKLLYENKLLKKRAEKNKKEIQHYKQANAELKERCICSFEVMTEKIKEEIQSLEENEADSRCLTGQKNYRKA